MTDYDRLIALQKYYKEHGVLPSYSNIAKIIGYTSKSAVATFLEKLKTTENIALTPENKIKPGKKFKKPLDEMDIFIHKLTARY